MTNVLSQILIFAYAGVAIISIIGYIPTIKDLFRHKKSSANISSYIIWTITNAITCLYSLFILPDLLFQIVSALSFVSCAVILFLSILLTHNK